ncbi:MAG: TraR/DksA family transcriptional regulator [Planctomycetes bacterium]|nr:TraR/DksA family transcriptional regulator [Planctomycetota bacterium]
MARKKINEPSEESRVPERVTAEVVEEIKVALLQKKAALSRNINSELDEMRTASEGHHLADMDDLGGDANDEETNYKILEIESAELDQIDYALERIDNGSYGVCEECEKPINPERLRALPFASLCITCKRSQEAAEG